MNSQARSEDSGERISRRDFGLLALTTGVGASLATTGCATINLPCSPFGEASKTRYSRYLETLLSKSPKSPHRRATTIQYKKCADWVANGVLKNELGFEDVRMAKLFVSGLGSTYNIIARVHNPKVETKRTYTVCAHLDSVEPSPGGNDNGSGVAAVLELAALLKERIKKSRHLVQFIFFGGEEMGLAGSEAFCANAFPDNQPTLRVNHRVVNIDTIAGPKPIGAWGDYYLEYRGDLERGMVHRLKKHAGKLSIIDSDLETSWVGRCTNDTHPLYRISSLASDHLSFHKRSVAAVSITQHPAYDAIHKPADGGVLDIDRATSVVSWVARYLDEELSL